MKHLACVSIFLLAFHSHANSLTGVRLKREIESASVFDTGIVSTGRAATYAETRELATALRTSSSKVLANVAAYIARHASSPYTPSLCLGYGLAQERQGAFLGSEPYFRRAFELSRGLTSRDGKAIAARSLAELALLRAKAGDEVGLRSVLSDARGREVFGASSERLHIAREQLRQLESGQGFGSCAQGSLLRLAEGMGKPPDGRWSYRWRQRHTTLSELRQAAGSLKLPVRVVFRKPNQPVPVPSVALLRIGHYVFVGGSSRRTVQIEDPAIARRSAYSRFAFDRESTGFYLADARCPLRSATVAEMSSNSGAGGVDQVESDQTGSSAQTAHPCGGDSDSSGLSRYDLQLLVAGLTIYDTPVGYTPAAGPDLKIQVRYNQREYDDYPANFSGFGPKWNCNFFSLVQYDTSQPTTPPTVFLRGGGTSSDPLDTYNRDTRALVHMDSSSPLSFERDLPDGSKEFFRLVTGSTSVKNVFLTSVSDAWGNSVTLAYDTSKGVRLQSITDAFGSKTVFSYTNSDSYLITKITDPFERSCSFSYNSSDYLASITDVIGITSSYTYASNSDFIEKLQTPYGVSTFTSDANNDPNNVTDRYIQAKDADGLQERVEFDSNAPNNSNLPDSDQIAPADVQDQYLSNRNSFYWDKKSFPTGYGNGSRPNYLLATIYHFYHSGDTSIVSGVIETVKHPLESRDWFSYAGQTQGIIADSSTIASSLALVERALNDGSVIANYSLPSNLGFPVTTIDAEGRMRALSYAYNNVDLTAVYVVNYTSGFFQTAQVYGASNYLNHKPQTIVNRSGGVTKLAYNGYGQVTQITDPLQGVTKFAYGSHGFLMSVVGPTGQTIAAFVPDTVYRVAQVTDSTGSITKFTYDDADRILTRTYSDGTHEQLNYIDGQLEPSSSVDRQGRKTAYTYTPIHQLKTVTDPAGRVTTLTWCSCGSLAQVTDARENSTTLTRDIEGRLTGKTYADGTQVAYTYEVDSGRLSTVTDALNQVKSYTYNLDGSINSVAYQATVQTPSVIYSYDPVEPRLSSVSDGTGTTTYTYNPENLSPGAGQLQSVARTDGAEMRTYTYDALGRVIKRQIGQITESEKYDGLGRITSDENPLGTFAYSYLDASKLLTSITGGQVSTTLAYQAEPMPVRLKSLTNKVGSTALDSFAYTYAPAGAIATWSGALPATTASPNVAFSYDGDDWLTGWQEQNASGAVRQSNTFGYDATGNRTGWLDGAGQGAATSAASKVNQFAEIKVDAPGTNTLLETLDYKYDANGSLTGLTTKTSSSTGVLAMSWDGENRIASISQSSGDTVFTYGADNLIHQSVFTPTGGGSATTTYFDWEGTRLIAMRTSGGTKHFFKQGVVETSGALYFYSRDHLGSIREVVDVTGKTVAQYQYGPYGLATQTAGTYSSDLGYAGYLNGVFLFAPFRAYDPTTGRWISRDPLGEVDELNLYGYAYNQPSRFLDFLGRKPGTYSYPLPGIGGGGAVMYSGVGYTVSIGLSVQLSWPPDLVFSGTYGPLVGAGTGEFIGGGGKWSKWQTGIGEETGSGQSCPESSGPISVTTLPGVESFGGDDLGGDLQTVLNPTTGQTSTSLSAGEAVGAASGTGPLTTVTFSAGKLIQYIINSI